MGSPPKPRPREASLVRGSVPGRSGGHSPGRGGAWLLSSGLGRGVSPGAEATAASLGAGLAGGSSGAGRSGLRGGLRGRWVSGGDTLRLGVGAQGVALRSTGDGCGDAPAPVTSAEKLKMPLPRPTRPSSPPGHSGGAPPGGHRTGARGHSPPVGRQRPRWVGRPLPQLGTGGPLAQGPRVEGTHQEKGDAPGGPEYEIPPPPPNTPTLEDSPEEAGVLWGNGSPPDKQGPGPEAGAQVLPEKLPLLLPWVLGAGGAQDEDASGEPQGTVRKNG